MILFVAVALVPLLVSATASVLTGLGFGLREVTTRQRASVMTIGPYVAAYVETVFNNLALIGIIDNPTANTSSLGKICTTFGAQYAELALLDAAGNELVSLRNCQPVPAPELGNRATEEVFFRAQRGESFLGSVSFLNQNQPLVAMSRAVETEQGQIVVAAVVNLKDLWEALNILDLESGSYFYVVDQRGNLISYRDFTVVEQEPNISNFPTVTSLRGASTMALSEPYIGLLGSEVVGTSMLIPGINWGIVVEQPTEQAFAFQQAQLSVYLILLGIVLVLALLIAYFLARSIVRPITVLADAALAVSAGDLSRALPVGANNELGTVSQAFNTMTNTLRQTIGGLEQRVEMRTADLTAALQTQAEQSQQLQASLSAQQQLNAVVAQLSVPIIPVEQDVLVLPLVGRLDGERMGLVSDQVLHAITHKRTRAMLFDLTGVPIIDQDTAHRLVQMLNAVRLVGVQPIIVGINPEVAESLVHFGDLAALPETWANLQQGLLSLHRRTS